jgi:hypothetical protein
MPDGIEPKLATRGYFNVRFLDESMHRSCCHYSILYAQLNNMHWWWNEQDDLASGEISNYQRINFLGTGSSLVIAHAIKLSAIQASQEIADRKEAN